MKTSQNIKSVMVKLKGLIFILLLLNSFDVIPQDGFLDISFSDNGVLTLPNPTPNSSSYGIITDISNNIFIYGGNQIIKLDENGQYDNNFANSGIMTFPYNTIAINKSIILQNNKILVVGRKANDIFISRINQNGSLDTTFGSSGFFQFNNGFGNDEAFSIIESDNAFIAVGYIINENNNKDFIVLKITQDGLLDENFGNNGVIIVNNNNNDDILNDIIINENNDIFACGSTYDPNAYFDNRYDLSVIKINSNQLDSNFGNNGLLVLESYSNESAINIDFHNNSLFITGTSMSIEGNFYNLNFYKTDTNGTLDNDFGTGGVVNIFHQIGSPFDNNKPIKQENGKFIFGTKLRFNETYTRINWEDGSIDGSFGNEGYFTFEMSRSNLYSLTKQFNNRFLALGKKYNGSSFQHVLTRHILNDNVLQIDTNNLDEFIVYPNPNNSILFLSNHQNLHINKIYIADISGKVIMELTRDFDLINLEKFESGIYILNIHTESSIISKKIIKL